MSFQRSSLAIASVTALFVIWHIVNHVFLMQAQMITYHVVSLAVEATLASAAIIWIARAGERARLERERAEALAVLVLESLDPDESESGPLSGLVRTVDGLETELAQSGTVTGHFEDIRRYAREMHAVNCTLRGILWPGGHGTQETVAEPSRGSPRFRGSRWPVPAMANEEQS